MSEGAEALRSARWEDARAIYEAALAEEETAEALEGLGLALRFGDDHDRCFEAQERAYRLYRERGDARGAGRMATRLSRDTMLLRGERAIAGGWLARAERLLAEVPEGAEHGWLALRKGQTVYYGLHDPAQAQELAGEAARLGREGGDGDLEMAGIALRGLALVAAGEVDAGMRALDEATTAAVVGEISWPDIAGGICCDLIFACELTQDLERAGEWCDAAEEIAERGGIPGLFSVCRSHRATLLMLRGRWSEAESELERSRAIFERSAKGMEYEAVLRLAELRRRQGQLAEAEALCGRAAWHPRASLCLARIEHERGNSARALEILAGQLDRVPAGDPLRAPSLELAVAVGLGAGERGTIAGQVAELEAIAARCDTPHLHGAAALARGRLLAAEGEVAGARTSVEAAGAAFERAASPYEAAQARLVLATLLRDCGEADRAEEEERQARMRIAGLRSERGGEAVARTAGGLSERELEVLRLVAEGLGDEQIAERLVLSPHTVHRHVANIRTKLGQPSRAAAVAHAARAGLL